MILHKGCWGRVGIGKRHQRNEWINTLTKEGRNTPCSPVRTMKQCSTDLHSIPHLSWTTARTRSIADAKRLPMSGNQQAATVNGWGTKRRGKTKAPWNSTVTSVKAEVNAYDAHFRYVGDDIDPLLAASPCAIPTQHPSIWWQYEPRHPRLQQRTSREGWNTWNISTC